MSSGGTWWGMSVRGAGGAHEPHIVGGEGKDVQGRDLVGYERGGARRAVQDLVGYDLCHDV